MRTIDISASPRADAGNAACGDGPQDASQFGDSLRAAARRASGPTEPAPSLRTDADAAGPANEESSAPHSTPATDKASPTQPRMDPAHASSTPAPQASLASPRAQAPAPTPPPAARTAATPRHPDAQPRASTPMTHADAAQPRASAAADPRDERSRAHAPGHERAPQRNLRKHGDTTPPPEGVALQTLLAAAHPLLAGAGDTAPAAASTPSALTPHDVAASVAQAWLREPAAQDAAGEARSAQWTFTLGDPLTPLAALRISGDAAAGWGLQLTAGNGLPARDLAAYTERLRQRLRARGQAVDRLEVDDAPRR